MSTPTNRQPEAFPSGGQFAPSVHAEPRLSLVPAEPTPAIMASVDLQQWKNDYAVTLETVEFDAGSILARMTPEERTALEDYSETADELYFEAVRQGLVKDHAGPFGLSICDAMTEAEERDPEVWGQDRRGATGPPGWRHPGHTADRLRNRGTRRQRRLGGRLSCLRNGGPHR